MDLPNSDVMPRAEIAGSLPDGAALSGSQLTSFLHYCETIVGRTFDDYSEFERFSVEEFREFWRLFLCWAGVHREGEIEPVCLGDACESAQFFQNLQLNYAENLLVGEPDSPAVTIRHRGGGRDRLTRRQLYSEVVRLAAALGRLGVRRDDRVVAIGRNNVEVVVAALATAAVGAVFSSCPQDMGSFAILARFGPLAPVVLFGNLRPEPWDPGIPIATRFAEVAAGLPSLTAIIALDEGALPEGLAPPVCRLADLICDDATNDNFVWQRYPFNHPLFILFSSGTTGLPKCIVHGAGGTLLEHLKEHRLHCDLRTGDKLFFQTSCGWMMWNWQLSALASGVELVLYDGPLEGPETLWQIVAEEGVTVFGTNPAYLQFCQVAGFSPSHEFKLSALRSVLSTGSILYPHQYDWVNEHVKALPLQSISGGTDIIGCFVLGNPNRPVHRGQAQCRSLGLDVRALPPADAPGAMTGELICGNPFPSRPVGFYGDADASRFHEAYFSQNPGVWTHGDLVEFTPQGGAILHGRSDGVLNIRGIRVGPAEIYRILQDIDEVAEAMAIEQQVEDEPGGTRLILLVVLSPGAVLDGALTARLRSELFARGSAALVPARVAQVDELPVTYSGKRSEAAARDALNGRSVRNRDALQNPDCLEAIANHPTLRTSSPVAQPRGQPIGSLTAGVALERELQEICERVLGVSPIQWSDDLLQYGADSLTILNLMMEIEDRTKYDLTLNALFAAPTVASLASLMRGGSAVKEEGQVKAIVARLDSAMAPASLKPAIWWAQGWVEDLFPATFRWRYVDRASDGGTWMVFDEDQCVAMLDSFVRPYLLDGRRVLVREPADWFCLPKYRPLGFGLLLMRMMMDLPEPIINIGGTDPTLAILPRLGWESLPEVQRMILPVTLRGLTGNLLRHREVRHAKYARAIPGFIPVRRPRIAPPPTADARVEEWRPGSELPLLVPRRDGLIELLELADLEWRLAAPQGFIRPIVLVFRLGDEPVGVSLSQLEPSASGPDGRIVHLQISNLAQPVVDWIVSATARRLSQEGVGFIRCRASIPPTITALRKTGFIATAPQAAHWWAKAGTPPPSVIEVGYLIANHALPFDTAATLRTRYN